MSRLVSLLLAFYIVLNFHQQGGGEALLGGLFATGLILSLIWYSDWWSQLWLGFGLMAFLAKDFHSAGQQGPVVALMGWILLLLLTWAVS